MQDYRASYATPNQIDSLWTVIGSMRKQIEQLSGQLKRMEAAAGAGEQQVSAQGDGTGPLH